MTLIYLVYVMGIFMGPLTGRFSNRYGGGNSLVLGTCVLGVSLLLLLIPSVAAVILGLLGVAGVFHWQREQPQGLTPEAMWIVHFFGRPVATDLDERHPKGYKRGLPCGNKMIQDGLGKADFF